MAATRVPSLGFPVLDPQGSRTSPCVPLPVSGASQVARREGPVARRPSGPGLPHPSWAWPLGRTQRRAHATAEEFRLMAVLHQECQPALPPGSLPPPFGEEKRPHQEKHGKSRPSQCPSSLAPTWRLPCLLHTGGGGRVRGSFPLLRLPGAESHPVSSGPSPVCPDIPTVRHPSAMATKEVRAPDHTERPLWTPRLSQSATCGRRSWMGRAFPCTRVPPASPGICTSPPTHPTSQPTTRSPTEGLPTERLKAACWPFSSHMSVPRKPLRERERERESVCVCVCVCVCTLTS